MTFPLPLAPFEYYMLADDQPDRPMAIFCRLEWAGCLERNDFEQALQAALDRHPLLHARVQAVQRNHSVWIDAEEPPFRDWDTADTPISFPDQRHIPLDRESGLRIWVRQGESSAEVWMQVHHACCDGIGLLRFLEDLLIVYHNKRSQPADRVEFRALDPEALKTRGDRPSKQRRRFNPWKQLRELYGTIQFFLRNPALPWGPCQGKPSAKSAPYPAFLSHRFTLEESRGLSTSAEQVEATTNDVLLRDLFRTLQRWNQKHGPNSQSGYLRLAMPINLRQPCHNRMPAANLVSVTFLDHKLSRQLNDEELLKAILRRTQGIKRRRWGSSVRIFSILSRLGLLRTVLMTRRATVTSMLSNLGQVLTDVPLPRDAGRLVAGDLVLENLDMLAPLRSGMSAAFVVYWYARRLNVCMSYDALQFTESKATELLACFVDQVQNSCSSQCSTVPV